MKAQDDRTPDPQTQAMQLPWSKLFAFVLHRLEQHEVSITVEDVAAFARDGLVLVVGPNPDDRTIRFRLLPEADADRERQEMRRNLL